MCRNDTPLAISYLALKMSKHHQYIIENDEGHSIFRPKGKRFEVLSFQRLEYTPENVSFLSEKIRTNLTDDLISNDVRKKYPSGHPRWNRTFFGHCVPATFAFLYFMNTNILSPVRGQDIEGEGHWWLIDNNNGDIIDLTKDQYGTDELVGVYSTGKKRGYYGFKEAPASRFFRLMQRVQPTSNLYETDSLGEIKMGH